MSDSIKLINAFRDDLLRWNSQINLVSRQETADRLEGLFKQCVGGAGAVLDHLNFPLSEDLSKTQLFYFDLGSGGGLPGVIWHVLFSEQFETVKSWLVEPREKRSWFLKRLNRISGMPSFGVLHGRWGEVCIPGADFSWPGAGFPVVVISLKALHLEDPEVLNGVLRVFSRLPGSIGIVIARYYPPGQAFNQKLQKSLKIPTAGDVAEIGGNSYRARGGSIIPLFGPGAGLASLVLSSYLVSAKE